MRHQVKDATNGVVVHLYGDVDLENSPKAREILLDSVGRKRDVFVDLSNVNYIDSSGVASLIEARQAAKSLNTRFGIVGLSGAPLHVIQVAQLEKIFPMYPTVADGVADKA